MRQIKIILVDDDPLYTDLLKFYIEKSLDESIRLLIFNNSQEALNSIKQDPNNIAVIILDYQMPEVDGLEFINRIITEIHNT
ncbi:MAG: hypothetical protein CK427_10355, partial [Leptospira sp.]